MPPVAAAVAAYFGISTAMAYMVIAYSVIMVATIAYAAYSMSNRPDMAGFSAEARGRTQVLRSAVAPHRIVYGQDTVSGPLVAAFSCGTNNKYLYLVIALTSHEVEEIGDVYIGDVKSTDVKFQDPAGLAEKPAMESFTVPAGGVVRVVSGMGNTPVVCTADVITDTLGVSVWQKATASTDIHANLSITHNGNPVDPSEFEVYGREITFISDTYIGETVVLTYDNYSIPVDPALYTVMGRTFTFDASLEGDGIGIHYNSSHVSVAKHLGGAGQTADPDLMNDAEDANGNKIWTANHTLSGRAYLVVRLEWHPTILAAGIPNIKAVVKGVKDIYDPRDSSTGWTDNAALCIRDYLTKAHGINAPSADINDTNFAAAANICDEDVEVLTGTGAGYTTDGSAYAVGRTAINLITGTGTILAGDTITITVVAPPSAESYVVAQALDSTGQIILAGDGLTVALPAAACAVAIVTPRYENRYTCNGTFTLDKKPIDIMKKMLTSCAGRLVWSQGQYMLYPAAYSLPDAEVIDENDLRDDISIAPAPSRQQRFNTVRGTFISPAQHYQQVDFPRVQDATQYAADQNEELCQTLELPYTNSASMAQRLAKIFLNQNLRGITVNFPGKLTVFSRQPGDVIKLSLAELGWVEKEFRVTDWRLAENGGVDLVLREEDSTVYTWTTGDETAFVPTNPAYQGPPSDNSNPYITVGATAQEADYTDLVTAIAALPASGGKIFIKNSATPYVMTAAITIPDKDIEILGESEGGVILKNNPGDDLFVLHNLTKTFKFGDFSITSQNMTEFSKMIHVYGDTPAENTLRLVTENITMTLKDNGIDAGDTGLHVENGNDIWAESVRLSMEGGLYGLYCKTTGLAADFTGIMRILNSKLSNQIGRGITARGTMVDVLSNKLTGQAYGIYALGNGAGNIAGNEVGCTLDGILTLIPGAKIGKNVINMSPTAATDRIGIFSVSIDDSSVNNNTVTVTANIGQTIYGILLTDANKGDYSGNTVTIDNPHAGSSNIGIGLTSELGGSGSSYNTISNNRVDMVNGTARDVGMKIYSDSNYNTGSRNVFQNCGANISDDGTGNRINVSGG